MFWHICPFKLCIFARVQCLGPGSGASRPGRVSGDCAAPPGSTTSPLSHSDCSSRPQEHTRHFSCICTVCIQTQHTCAVNTNLATNTNTSPHQNLWQYYCQHWTLLCEERNPQTEETHKTEESVFVVSELFRLVKSTKCDWQWSGSCQCEAVRSCLRTIVSCCDQLSLPGPARPRHINSF